ncbi:hypothetical protein PUV54_13340 [Hyphococcus flavus]|uniref:Uncharacterized protein n=1 Tax=Hyphococcus flavus TaxID=1866326 RepID=A0AAE9ZAV2_9PROT|nr:hypothetical protein [Hyphococcus flavus]WDI30938.1 hypothetical protein PUV54_13340 [Hyphococcus flavus]
MARALSASGARYDVRPAGENRGAYGAPFRGPACIIKDALQGAGAGFLSLTGATSIASGETMMAASSDLGMLGEIFPSLVSSGLTGPLQLVGGVLLFLAARRTISRTAGLMAFIAFVAAYANGYDIADMLQMASNVLQGAAGALESIPVTENASI